MIDHFIAGLICLISLIVFNKPETGTISPPTVKYTFLEGSSVTANGTTNIRPFSCVCLYNDIATGPQTTITVSSDASAAYFRNAILKVNIASLNCGINDMNSNLCRALKTDQYPYLIIRIKEASSVSHRPIDFTRPIRLKVETDISMAGVTREDTVMMEGNQAGKSIFHFTGQNRIQLKEYGIEPPTALFGLIKVRNVIVIRFDLEIKAHVIS